MSPQEDRQDNGVPQYMILIVGGADTGRAPITAALLRRLLSERQLPYIVESAGVLGHDGEYAESEAINTMITFDIDISNHIARSVNDELVAQATLLVTMDAGTANVMKARYPNAAQRTVTLGMLAGRQRDIPDLFRMQIGAWITYTREIEGLLQAGLDRLIGMINNGRSDSDNPQKSLQPEAPQSIEASQTPLTNEQQTALEHRKRSAERCQRLLKLLVDMPGLIVWEDALRQLEAEIQDARNIEVLPGDLIQPYATLLLGLLGMNRTVIPVPEQIIALCRAVECLGSPINQQGIAELSSTMAEWRATK